MLDYALNGEFDDGDMWIDYGFFSGVKNWKDHFMMKNVPTNDGRFFRSRKQVNHGATFNYKDLEGTEVKDTIDFLGDNEFEYGVNAAVEYILEDNHGQGDKLFNGKHASEAMLTSILKVRQANTRVKEVIIIARTAKAKDQLIKMVSSEKMIVN